MGPELVPLRQRAFIEGCPDCGGWLETKMRRFGRFLGCSSYPACEYTQNLKRRRQ